MIKLVIGVILLVLILITAYYILVEKEKENFQNRQNNQPDRACGRRGMYENDFDDFHRSFMPRRHYQGGGYNMLQLVSKLCFKDFLKDPKDFYSKYVRNLQSNYEPLNFQDFHEKMLKVSIEPSGSNHDNGNLIPKAADKSHCALYTNDCNLTALNMDDYLDESSYIEGNMNQLAMCHADTDCKLESSMLQICKNKCDQEVGLDEECTINGCTQSENFYFDKKDIHKCYGNSKEECNSLPGCEYSDTTEICNSKCYNLSEDECTTNEQCYLTSYGSCSDRQCDENQESSFPTDVTNAVSNLNLRTHYCTKKCYAEENQGNECHSFDLNRCRRENKCSVLDKFVVPKCVPNNVN